MFLKSIEIQGFKSFANKIKFEFNDGITAIVGPNGSGKSNVADAVRWVLGEQRVKQLRGGNMQDVIFSGTENRKPLSYATVSITLDNSDHALSVDYEEVTVTRRLYRSGESEYLLNGTVCRLKDVNELFYDTGIGKEGYSIIGQGQIDRILSEKPEDRRELFDEAAGIVKFKRRKNITQKKLEDEHGNLLRVTDIINELENQKGPLEEQSVKARDYLKKKDELKTYDINMFLLETERLKERIDEVDKQIAIVNDELTDSNNEFAATKEQYSIIDDELDQVDASISESRDQLNKTNILKQQLEGRIDILKEQINTVRTNDEHYSKRSEAIVNDLNLRKEQAGEYNRQKEELSEKLALVNAELKKAEEEYTDKASNISDTENSIESTKSEIISTLNERAQTQSKLQRYDTIMEQNSVRRSEIDQKVISLKTDEEGVNEYLKKCREELNRTTGLINSLNSELKETEDSISEVSEEIKALNRDVDGFRAEYHRENSRLEALKNMAERYDGYGNSIRKVMERKSSDSRIEGVVADIISTEPRFELAIETALGASIQNIVVQDEACAKKLITYLKENRLGRATFLPLTSVKNSQEFKERDVLKERGVVGIASDVVRYDSKYKGVVSHLLGRTLVADNMDNAVKAAGKFGYRLRIVTLEGELLQPGGSLTGGAYKNANNLLGRKREIEELESGVADVLKRLKNSERSLEDKKERKTALYAHLDKGTEELNRLKITESTGRVNEDTLIARLDEIKKELDQTGIERKQLDSQVSEIAVFKDRIKEELILSEKNEKDALRSVEEKSAELEKLRDDLEKSRKKTEEIRLHASELEQRDSFIDSNLKRISDEISRYESELEEIRKDMSGSSDEILSREEEIRSLTATIEESADLFAEIEAVIEEAVKHREELNQKHKDFIERREELSLHIAELDKEQYRLTARREGFDKAYNDQISYMWDEYEITLNRAAELRDPQLTNLSFIKKQISALKADMKNMGPVNINAIEDYKQLLERYEFLTGQRDDLVQAEESLNSIIDKLDSGMRRQFEQQFKLIKEEFHTVFGKLFGGGTATLELVEGDDILEAGIRIIAQPPGKKLQNMMQMSGGEKALTAIALLFAIQNLKPSPFCLLDEIEAALDDANVKRFADYLEFLTENTQFIMITHRRGTMAAADRLYGITMQEKGVSTLVSVDLLEDKLDA